MRFLRLLLFCLAGLSGLSVAAQSPARPSPVPASSPDQGQLLKGKLWTGTAARVWEDFKLPEKKRPARWDTPDDFEKWRKQNSTSDQSGLVGLRDSVRSYVKRSFGHENASPTELKTAILHEVGALNYRSRHVDKPKLAATLNALVPATVAGKDTTGKAEALAASATLPAAEPLAAPKGAIAAAQPARAGGADSGVSASPATADRQKLGSGSFPWSLVWAGLGGFLLGFVGSAVLRQFLRKQQALSQRASEQHPQVEPREARKLKAQESRIERLEQEAQELRQQNAQLRQQATQLQTASAKSRKTNPATNPPPPAALAAASVAEPVPVAPPTALLVFYAPVLDEPYLDQHQLKPDATPHHALKITLRPDQPDTADFEFNTSSDQQSLIEYRLNALRQYFDIAPFTGRPAAFVAAGPGTLTRHGDGWQVALKARLDVR